MQRDDFLQRLITKSIEIKNRVLSVDEKLTRKRQYQAAGDISDIELQITKILVEVKDDGNAALTDMRDHLIELF